MFRNFPCICGTFFLGNLSLGFEELSGVLAHLPVRPCFQQQQNNKGNLCFESVLITVGSHFSVLRSQVFCRILGRDFDDGRLLVGRFFCVPTLESALLWAITSAFSCLGDRSILARIVYLTIKDIAISFAEQT